MKVKFHYIPKLVYAYELSGLGVRIQFTGENCAIISGQEFLIRSNNILYRKVISENGQTGVYRPN